MNTERHTDGASLIESMGYRGSATQRVKDFVVAEAQQLRPGAPRRLPPMRKLAEHLGVSVATIQTAFRQLQEEGIIESKPNRASFIKPLGGKDRSRVYHIGLDFLKGDENLNRSWRGNLHGGILQQALNCTNRIAFHHIPSDNLSLKDLHPRDLPGGLDGVILAMRGNIRNWQKLHAGIPAVFHAPAQLDTAANFVVADLYQAAQLTGKAFAAAGRRRPCLATHSNFDSAELGWIVAGLIAGFREDRPGHQPIGTLHFGREETEEPTIIRGVFADPETAPDAIFCSSDYTAMNLLRMLKEMGIGVPGQVSVVGGTGLILMHTEFFTMTRAFQPLPDIGAELVKRLVAAIDADDPSCTRFPGVFLRCSFGGGETTLPEENRVLGIPAQAEHHVTPARLGACLEK